LEELMTRWLDRLPGRILVLAVATALVGASSGTAPVPQADTTASRQPVVITQADIDALTAQLQHPSSDTIDYLNSLVGAAIGPDGTIVRSGATARRTPSDHGFKMATALGGLVSDHATYASFVDAEAVRMSPAEAAPSRH
jgi:hypothetical protein